MFQEYRRLMIEMMYWRAYYCSPIFCAWKEVRKMKFGKYFTYNGDNSENYGLMIASFESGDDDLATGLERSLITGESTKYRFRANHFGAKYENALTFKITLVKDPCSLSGDESQILTRKETRMINRWLTGPSYPTLFHMYDEDYDFSDEKVDYNGIFSNVEYKLNGMSDVIGITFTFTNDSPFAYTPLISKTLTAKTMLPYEGTINNDSDELENPLYPCLTITPTYPNDITDVKIENLTDEKSMTYEWLDKGAQLYIDCEKAIIQFVGSDELVELHKLGITDVSSIYWFRLLPGRNQIKITGDVTIRLQYRELRKVGAY